MGHSLAEECGYSCSWFTVMEKLKKHYLAGRVDDKRRWKVDEMSLDCRCLTSGLSRDYRGEEGIVETAIFFRLA